MTFLIDSNIIVYSFSNEYNYLREFIVDEDAVVSEITRIEVLGYHGLKEEEESYFQSVFDFVQIIIPNQEIYNQAIFLRRKYNLKLGDSLIAATASIHNLSLYTRNSKDFARIKQLNCINPVL